VDVLLLRRRTLPPVALCPDAPCCCCCWGGGGTGRRPPLRLPPLPRQPQPDARPLSEQAPHGIAHSKAPIELADELPIVVTTEDVAKCDGGGGALGHPTEFIKNNKGYPNECKYCGARFVQPEFAAKYIPGFDQLAWVKEHAHGHH